MVENQQVSAGQLLIELDNREADTEHDKAEGERQAAAAQKAYDTEAAEFDKAVREGAKDARKSSTRK